VGSATTGVAGTSCEAIYHPNCLHTGDSHPVTGGIGDSEAPGKVGELPAARHDQHRTPDLPEDAEQADDPVKETPAHLDDQRGCKRSHTVSLVNYLALKGGTSCFMDNICITEI